MLGAAKSDSSWDPFVVVNKYSERVEVPVHNTLKLIRRRSFDVSIEPGAVEALVLFTNSFTSLLL
jgi:hypothetical protein